MHNTECTPELLTLISSLPEFGLTSSVRLAALLSRSGSADADDLLRALGTNQRTLERLIGWQRVPAWRHLVEERRASTLTILDPDYPQLLREIAAPPLALRVEGNSALPAMPGVAIVGSRNATTYGLNVARLLASRLAAAGLLIVSGFARGIDGAAHTAAIEAGGNTVAVLGTGHGVDYPRGHGRLREQVRSAGALLSEYAPGTPPRPANFPVRNRIIAGMVRAVIVIEAGTRSGSLVTARLALEQNREVFAVPGSILRDSSAGCHSLIRQGAQLLSCVDDVLDDLGLQTTRQEAAGPPPAASTDARALWDALTSEDGAHVDAICERLGWTPQRVAAAALELELSGAVMREPGGRLSRRIA